MSDARLLQSGARARRVPRSEKDKQTGRGVNVGSEGRLCAGDASEKQRNDEGNPTPPPPPFITKKRHSYIIALIRR